MQSKASNRPPRRQKTKEKLKNPQQPNTRALECQEGLKQRYALAVNLRFDIFLESQEGLKLAPSLPPLPAPFFISLESQEGLKHVGLPRAVRRGQERLESQEGLKQ